MNAQPERSEKHAAWDRAAHALSELAALLGSPPRNYAMHGEGNISLRLDQQTFLIKASGMTLGGASYRSFVHCDLQRVLTLVHSDLRDDEAIAEALAECRADQRPALRPSVETGVHAVLLEAGAGCVAHVYPVPITGLLCSEHPTLAADGALYPDQVVVCGPRFLYLPYVDPGLPLARALERAVHGFQRTHHTLPKAIYLQNNGFIAAGHSEAEALAIIDVAVKAAEILIVALGAGGPRYLSEAEVQRIAGRSDEHYRQRALGLTEQ